jgi:3-amino-4-hydroxybenzoic acid synthase
MKSENQTLIEPSTRRPVQLQNVASALPGQKSSVTQIWFDTRKMENLEDFPALALRLINFGYSGVLITADTISIIEKLPPTLLIIVKVESEADLSIALKRAPANAVILSSQLAFLEQAQKHGLVGCLHQYVDDGDSLHRSIHLGRSFAYLMIHFRDPTNIPLELVIASLQATKTTLIKEISNPLDVDDAVVALDVMEVGADGVMYSPPTNELLDTFIRKLAMSRSEQLTLEPATIINSEPVGTGYRSCIDLATLFTESEGMVIGSTSQGGILACPEVFYLPYMQTRPFRVNAGGVHSYVYNSDNRTDYMSELRAGTSVLIVGLDGKTRKAPVGRMKTELRPLRLIEAQFSSGEVINIIMQDDWHVRVFSPEGAPLNVTELKPGDRVMAHKAIPGRHVGIKIEENILEK